MKRIPLTQGLFALVDDSDYERVVAAGSWYAQKSSSGYTYYAMRWSPSEVGKRFRIHLHHFVLDVTNGVKVDHRDGNGLNCSRANEWHDRQCEMKDVGEFWR